MYSVEYSKTAVKALAKLDRGAAVMVIAWIEKNLVGCFDPRSHGKALTGGMKGYWCYRVGTYRIIAKIYDNVITVNIINIGHRHKI